MSEMQGKKSTPPTWVKPFLDEYEQTLDITASAAVAGISRQRVYAYKDRNNDFAAKMRAIQNNLGYEAIKAIKERIANGDASDKLVQAIAGLVNPDMKEKPMQVNVNPQAETMGVEIATSELEEMREFLRSIHTPKEDDEAE